IPLSRAAKHFPRPFCCHQHPISQHCRHLANSMECEELELEALSPFFNFDNADALLIVMHSMLEGKPSQMSLFAMVQPKY
uniref:Uncharacterized protein n=1 Tax=Anopheles dirus TaxID=7168 RepID=A0A182NWJ6_9DIPT